MELKIYTRIRWDSSGCQCWWYRHPYPQKAERHISPTKDFKPQAGEKFQQSWAKNSCRTSKKFVFGFRSRDSDLSLPNGWNSVA